MIRYWLIYCFKVYGNLLSELYWCYVDSRMQRQLELTIEELVILLPDDEFESFELENRCS